MALVVLSLGLMIGAWAQAPAAQRPAAGNNQRLALVIGNATYKHQSVLRNTVNDARAFSQALRESGFTVIAHENADQRTMLLALREFGDRLRSGGTGLFYFSGHGMQIKGRNYLVPVDAAFEREDEIAYRTVDAQAVLDKMEVAGNASNIMILDACRTNPFVRSTRSGQQGLAPMDAPLGTLIAYATAPGTVASDGTGVNGLYTHHLLEAMRHPGMKVEDVFKLVRGNVRRESGGTQIPWEATSLEGDFYFRLNSASAAPLQLAAQPLPSGTSTPVDALELALWELVRNSTVPLEVAAYLNRYPNGMFSAVARARMAALGGAPAMLPEPSAPATAHVQTGPRPQPAANPAGFVVGDRWRFQVVDKFRSEVVRNYSNVVDAVLQDGSMVLDGGRVKWDVKGNTLSSESPDLQATYTDYVTVPPTLQAGARTSVNYRIARKSANGNFNDERKVRWSSNGRNRLLLRPARSMPGVLKSRSGVTQRAPIVKVLLVLNRPVAGDGAEPSSAGMFRSCATTLPLRKKHEPPQAIKALPRTH